MVNLTKHVHNYKYTRHNQTTEHKLTRYAHISDLTGVQINDTHPLAFSADTLGPNPNI